MISKKEAVSAISDLLMIKLNWERLPTYNEVYHAIHDLPSVDAVPVRHGWWIYHPDWQADGECGYECSECGRGVDLDYAYCPHCGARMDGKDGDHAEGTIQKERS